MSLGNISDITVERKPEIKHFHHDDIEKDCEEEDCTGGAECIIWQNKWQCMCVNNFKKPDGNGSCVEEQPVQILPSAIVKESFLHRQENQSHPKLSLNTSSNVTISISRDNHLTYSKEWLFLQLVLPITVFLFLCLLVSLMFYKKYKIMRLTSKRGSDGVMKPTDSVQLLDRMNNIQKNPSYFLPDGGKKETAHINELSVDNLKLLVVIGEGAFGQVFKGEIIDNEGATIENVAVKVLKYGVTNEVKEDFQREVTIMSGFDHDNILRLIGVVTKNIGDTPYMVFEYMIHGDLADMLRRPSVDQNGGQDKVLQKKDLIDIATQISNGMAYLASQHFLHRDLATRNCLVGEGFVVKIADFGMTRDIYTCDYYKIGGSRMLPVRWMSPESVKYGKFTIESDVWSYGVVLWEIFSWGRQPYYGHSNEEVIQFLDNGILLQRPKDCPSIVYHLMLGCWKQNPKERMPFTKIYNYLSEHNQLLARNGSVISSDIESAVQELFI